MTADKMAAPTEQDGPGDDNGNMEIDRPPPPTLEGEGNAPDPPAGGGSPPSNPPQS